MSCAAEGAANLLERLEVSHVLLVEWETSLWIRLGCPLVSDGSLFFLVPDDRLKTVRDLAADLGLQPADEKVLRPACASEFSSLALRYLLDDSRRPKGSLARRRLAFLPMSWAGLRYDELVSTSIEHIPRTPRAVPIQPVPRNVLTLSLATTCATLVRIVARENRGSRVRNGLIERFASVIGYSLFDMSYEGNYMEFLPNDEPLSDVDALEIEQAVAETKRWVFREDEEWIREMLVQIILGKKTYNNLPRRMPAVNTPH